MLYGQFRLNEAVSAAADYALINRTAVNSSNASDLAAKLAAIGGGSSGSDTITSTAVVNSGPTSVLADGKIVSSGSASAADSCYCPRRTSGGPDWGGSVDCGDDCPDGGSAGKFVWLSVTQPYKSIFGTYSIISNGQMTASTLAKVE